jgi:hypothetical protein
MAAEKQRLIFISYSRTNRNFALELAKELKASGFRVWFDQLDIPTGSRWDDEIEKALTQCEVFLVILTKQSIESHNVKDEIGYAIDSNKRILPILLEEVNVPFRLRRFQYVDFTTKSNNEGIDLAKQLLRTLMDEAEEAQTEPAVSQVPSRQPEPDRSEELQADAHRLARQRADAIRKAREREQMERNSQVTPSTPSFERIRSQPQPSIRTTPQPQKGTLTRRPVMLAGGVIISLLCLGVLWGAWVFWPTSPTPTTPPPTTVVPTTVTPSFTPSTTMTPSFTPIVPITTIAPSITPLAPQEPVQFINFFFDTIVYDKDKLDFAWDHLLTDKFKDTTEKGRWKSETWGPVVVWEEPDWTIKYDPNNTDKARVSTPIIWFTARTRYHLDNLSFCLTWDEAQNTWRIDAKAECNF